MTAVDADAEIQAVLAEARELAAGLDPLYVWDDLCEIIQNCRLAELDRHPDLERLYAGTFNPLLKRHYGTTEAYLRRQLGWPAQEATDEKQDREQFWTRGATTNVRRNDWPYAIPKEVQHWVVWVPLPLFHPLLCNPAAASSASSTSSSALASGTATPSGPSRTNPLAAPSSSTTEPTVSSIGDQLAPPRPAAAPRLPSADSLAARFISKDKQRNAPNESLAPTKGTWDWVSRNGLGGLTGQAADRFKKRYGTLTPNARNGTNGSSVNLNEEYDEGGGPEREIKAFVEKKWPVAQGWETAWFANPPGLQSVPGLAHFHVLARKSRDHQREVWPILKFVCGDRAHPFRLPTLTRAEGDLFAKQFDGKCASKESQLGLFWLHTLYNTVPPLTAEKYKQEIDKLIATPCNVPIDMDDDEGKGSQEWLVHYLRVASSLVSDEEIDIRSRAETPLTTGMPLIYRSCVAQARPYVTDRDAKWHSEFCHRLATVALFKLKPLQRQLAGVGFFDNEMTMANQRLYVSMDALREFVQTVPSRQFAKEVTANIDGTRRDLRATSSR